MSRETENPKFSPAWWVPGAHMQTMWAQFFRPTPDLGLRMERMPTPDGDHLYLFHRDTDSSRPRVLLLHGLEGSVRSRYVGGVAALAARRGWNFTFMTFRGCGPEFNTAPRLYHSGETTDVALVVDRLVGRSAQSSLFVAAVSLGGNVVLKWLGESGDRLPSQVKGAATVSVPYDLEAGAKHLQRGFSRVYDRHFLTSLKAKARLKAAQFDGLINGGRLEAAGTIEAFDDAVTAPVHGFTGSHDYYTRSSSIRWIEGIRIPTLLLSAEDDPFLPPVVLDRVREIARGNPNLRLHFTPHGGHVGYVSGRIPFQATYWAEERVMSFFDTLS